MREEQLFAGYRKKGDPEFRNAIVEAHIGLVRRIAGYFAGKTRLPYDDLEAEGCLGLMVAVERYDPEKAARTGTRFSSYAYWWVRRYVLRAVIHHGLLVSVPENVSELHYKYRQCFNRLAAISGCEPEPGDVVKSLDLSPRQARNIIRREDLREISIETPSPGDPDGPRLVESLVGKREKDLAAALQRDDRVEKCLSVLSPREREMISLRFGLKGRCPMTYQEMVDHLYGRDGIKISRQRAHQLVLKALKKIRAREEPEPGRSRAGCPEGEKEDG